MKVKKQIKKFHKLEKKIRNSISELSQSISLTTEEFADLKMQQEDLEKKRKKTLRKIFHYAVAH